MGLDKLGVPTTSECLYAACYWYVSASFLEAKYAVFSEENVWQLCKSIKCDDDSRLQPFYVVFISNDEKTVSTHNLELIGQHTCRFLCGVNALQGMWTASSYG